MQWTACASYSGKGVPDRLEGTIRVDLDTDMLDKRLQYLDSNLKLKSSFEVPIKLKQSRGEHCLEEKFELVVLSSNQFNRVQPIKIKANLTLAIPEAELEPIVNPYSNSVQEIETSLWKNCGKDNICEANLDLKVEKRIEDTHSRNEHSFHELVVDDQNEVIINSTLQVDPELSYGSVS